LMLERSQSLSRSVGFRVGDFLRVEELAEILKDASSTSNSGRSCAIRVVLTEVEQRIVLEQAA